jgi:hypothetical protein
MGVGRLFKRAVEARVMPYSLCFSLKRAFAQPVDIQMPPGRIGRNGLADI